LTNQVCDHALVLAYADGVTEISAALVEQAWADLQQLPTPWSVPTHGASRGAGETVEFGDLGDEPFDPDAAPHSVRFPSERIDRGTGPGAAAEGESFDDLAADGDDDSFSVHSADDELDASHAGEYVAGDAATQIELSIVETAADPFGEPFADEQPVVDRVASLGNSSKAEPVAPPRPVNRKVEKAARAAESANASASDSQAVAPPWPSGNPDSIAPLVPASAPAVAAAARALADARAHAVAAMRKPRKFGQLFTQLRRNSG
jgi:hypothetical protein